MSAAGFADPVIDSQAAFRAVLDAMSRPGTLVHCGKSLTPPTPLAPAAAAVLLALADYETPLWISPSFEGTAVRDWLKFHSGAPSAGSAKTAAFALVDLTKDALDLVAFAQGTAEYPDRSTTIVAQVAALSASGPLRLSGPGVKGEARLGFSPYPDRFLAQWGANLVGFPLGVDLVVASADAIAALPRSVRLSGDV